jgi:hypothetical protein
MRLGGIDVREDRSGWRLFGGLMILLVGIFNFIGGVVYLADPKFLYYYNTVDAQAMETTHHLIFGDLTTWGWTILIFGIVQVLTGMFVLFGRGWAALVGIALALLNAIGQLMLVGVYPWWSVLAIILDVLVIYALVASNLSRAPDPTV